MSVFSSSNVILWCPDSFGRASALVTLYVVSGRSVPVVSVGEVSLSAVACEDVASAAAACVSDALVIYPVNNWGWGGGAVGTLLPYPLLASRVANASLRGAFPQARPHTGAYG